MSVAFHLLWKFNFNSCTCLVVCLIIYLFDKLINYCSSYLEPISATSDPALTSPDTIMYKIEMYMYLVFIVSTPICLASKRNQVE